MREGYYTPFFTPITFSRRLRHSVDFRGCESRPTDADLLAEILNWALSHYPRMMMGSLDLLSVLRPSLFLPPRLYHSIISRLPSHRVRILLPLV